MPVKLGGYGSNRENARPSKYCIQKVMPIIGESQFPRSKNSIPMPFDTGVRGGRRTYNFVLTCANFRPLLATCDFSSIRVSHKLKSGTEL